MPHGMTRREVMQAGVLLAGGICGCRTAGHSDALLCSCCDTPELESESLTFGPGGLTIDLLKAPSLRAVGSAAYLMHRDKPLQLIVVHADKLLYCVLSRLCTHGGQVVSYNRRRGVLQCNGFNHSIFDLNGSVLKGPAEKPLRTYPVVFVENALVVSI